VHHAHHGWRYSTDCDLAVFLASDGNWRHRYSCYTSLTYRDQPYKSPPSDAVTTAWDSTERNRERCSLRGAVREYNAQGEVDDFDFPCYQHRRRATYWYY